MSKTDRVKEGAKIVILIAEVAGLTHQAWKWWRDRSKPQTDPTTDPTKTPQGVQTTAQTSAKKDTTVPETFQGHNLMRARLIKVVPSGNAFLIQLNEDGTLTEGVLHNPAENWSGHWDTTIQGGLILQIGEYKTVLAGARNGSSGYVGFEDGTNVTLYFVEQREEEQLFAPAGDPTVRPAIRLSGQQR